VTFQRAGTSAGAYLFSSDTAEELMATAGKNKLQRSDLNDLNMSSNEQVRRDELTETGEVPARFDSGSGETETDDGLDQYQEAARHGAEDVPAGERKKTLEDLPVFDRAETERQD
jgi:hypothetical protein